VEQLAAELWPDAISGCATAPDPRKGERVVLVTTQKNATRAAFIAFARSKGASELTVPADIIVQENLPMLGSGKIDNVALTKFVRERVRANAENAA
jgi:acyl-[acyl-carrier-protein]-phospholipid O-acyltransferase/long-chain-fatty-acid--[acyl-carrier-protein] ligase